MNYLVFLIPFVFAGMWVLVTFVISRFGWAALAEKYETTPDFAGTSMCVISASINWAEYKNSLTLKYNERGIYLRPVVVFRLFHKPVFIPWEEVKEIKDRKVFFFHTKELTVGEPCVARIVLQASVFNRLAEYMPAPYENSRRR